MDFIDYFKEISAIPRGSGNMEAISEYCYNFAKKRNLEVYRDDSNNVIIYKPATKGRENDDTVVIQSHLDMVAEKKKDSNHDFLKDGLVLVNKNGFLYADGTTLGADDGIGVAYSLAILADEGTISHPAITVVFTTDEEIGLDGAKALDMSRIRGRLLINIDNDIEDTLFSGSAGGGRIDIRVPYSKENKKGNKLKITVSGLKGGHSGAEIHKHRGNANVIMGRIFACMKDICEVSPVSITGGNKDNAIPRECEAVILVRDEDVNKIITGVAGVATEVGKEYADSDEGLSVDVKKLSDRTEACDTMDKFVFGRFVDLLNKLPDGVFSMTDKPMKMVETSSNMGILTMSEDAVNITISVRSMVGNKKQFLINKIMSLVAERGGTAEIRGEYPEWEYKSDSKLQRIYMEAYEKCNGKAMKNEAIHAGLECGYFAGYDDKFDIISVGPDIFDIHTTEERLDIASAQRTFEVIKEALKNIR